MAHAGRHFLYGMPAQNVQRLVSRIRRFAGPEMWPLSRTGDGLVSDPGDCEH